MRCRPPAFLERLVGRLMPASVREHVLGDLSERYRSTSQYIVDAAQLKLRPTGVAPYRFEATGQK